MAGPLSGTGLADLVRQTLFEPRAAASRLIDMRLPPEALWMALALLTVLNTIVYSVSLQLAPPPDPATMAMLPAAFRSPLLFALFLGGALAIIVLTLSWIGQSMGGAGGLQDILVLITWMQVLRLGLQAALLVIMLVSPALGGIVTLVASLWGLYILVAFVDRAHGFDSFLKSAGVLLIAAIAMVVGLSLILGVTGAAIIGGA